MGMKTGMEQSRQAEKLQALVVHSGRDGSWRWVPLLILAAVFITSLAVSTLPREETPAAGCLGVPILSMEEMEQLGTYAYRDYSEDLKFQNEYAAVDEVHSVIYIPQSIHQNTAARDLAGLLTVDVPGRKLYFAPDDNWENLSDAVAVGHSFRLLVWDHANTYMEYDVVFTTLPVMAVYGQLLYKDEDPSGEEMTEVMSGRMIMWDPAQLDGDGSGVQTSRLHWNARGVSSKLEPKNPWKLSLKDWNGDNSNVEFLQLGSDDDWILNSMNMEDSNIREKLFMDLWNEMAAETDYNYPMSQAEYVEVLINGEYYGLCMLQRRLDDKFLALEEEAVLVKAKPVGAELVFEYFSAGSSQVSDSDLNSFFWEGNCEPLVRENFVDVSLFLQLFATMDNLAYKNMYYLFDLTEETITLIPWDTDMSMGALWGGDGIGFVYDYEKGLQLEIQRREMEDMQRLHPELDQALSRRWFELREGLFSLEHITGRMDDLLKQLDASGAVRRDQEKWGLYFDGQDTMDNLYRFVEERLQVLDSYYG